MINVVLRDTHKINKTEPLLSSVKLFGWLDASMSLFPIATSIFDIRLVDATSSKFKLISQNSKR